MSGDFDHEPDLHERVPPGETILWQGAPSTMGLARRAYHVALVATYFAALALWSVVSGLADGNTTETILWSLLRIALVGGAAIGVLGLLARLQQRSSAYMITSQRVVLRLGVALPMTVNLPFRYITAADVNIHRDGTGDIALKLNGDRFLGFVHLWPHVRAWRLARPEPLLRAIPDARAVADTLAKALMQSQQAAGLAAPVADIAIERPRPIAEPRRASRGDMAGVSTAAA